MHICKQQTFENLNKRIQQCRKCNLSNLSVNQKNVATGSGKLLGWGGTVEQCKIMLVGQNPSHARYAGLELAFGGPAGDNQGVGKRFIDLLKSIDIFDKIYCTNLVKCSSVTNEINLDNAQNCIGHLIEEYDIVKPKIVIALGKQVFDTLTTLFNNYSICAKLFQTYHPSWIYRYKKVTEEKYYKIIKEICK